MLRALCLIRFAIAYDSQCVWCGAPPREMHAEDCPWVA